MIIEAIITCYVLKTIMSNGSYPSNGDIACSRHLKLGTEVVIQGKRYKCTDHLSRQYDSRFDIWMSNYKECLIFGNKKLKVKIW